MPMSFREKSAWACLVCTLVVFVPYFVFVAGLVQRGELSLLRVLVAFVAAVICQAGLAGLYHAAIALRTREEPADERDRAIEGRSVRAAYWVLLTGVMVLVLGVPMLGGLVPGSDSGLLVGQIALLCVVVAESVHFGVQAAGYRRGG